MKPLRLSLQRLTAPPSSVVATVVGAALAIASVQGVDPDRSRALGLVEALPKGYFVGVGLVLVAFVATLRRERLIRPLLVFELVTIICLLYGLTSYIEDVARLSTTWVHAGFIEYIQRTGHVLEGYDARMVWPGFFATGALLDKLAGTTDQQPFLLWAPLVLNLAFAIPIWLIARSTGAPVRACWLATCLFFLLNWVGQDYYSPQGLNFALATCFLAVMLRVFFTEQGVLPGWMKRTVEPVFRHRLSRATTWIERRDLHANNPPALVVSGRQKAAVVGALIILYAASVVSHQLTPFFLIIVTAGLVMLDRVDLRTLPIVMLIGVFIWISYAATEFWAGQIGNLFGDVGNVGNVVNANVNSRVSGNPDHLPVIYGRLMLAGTLWLTAGIGFIRRLRRHRLDLICVVGSIAPFSVLGGQAYGGEAMLRVYLFALPFAVTLAAAAFAPHADAWNKKTTALVTVVLLALLPVFFVSRYGNESFEHFGRDELVATEQLYKVAPPGSTLISLNANLPWRGERIENYKFSSLFDDTIPLDEAKAIDDAVHVDPAPKYLIVTRSQQEFAEMMQGQSPTWADDIVKKLIATNQYRSIYQNAEAQILAPVGQT